MTELQTKEASFADTEKYMRVCFVCMGNTCRSPMAAALFNKKAAQRGLLVRAFSAGLSAIDGDMISAAAADALSDFGVESSAENDYKNHRARRINAEICQKNDLLITVSSDYVLPLLCAYPEFSSKIRCLKNDIGDPFGGTLDDYRRTLLEIDDCLTDGFFDNVCK